MANFAASSVAIASPTQQNFSSSFKTLLEGHAVTSGRRFCLYEFEFGIDGTPNATDCSITWDVSRTTAAGTPNAAPIVAQPMDPADVSAAVTIFGCNHTAEPTVAVANSLFSLGANQRASYRWIAKDDKAGLWVAAVNLNGLRIAGKSATYASTAIATMHINEQ